MAKLETLVFTATLKGGKVAFDRPGEAARCLARFDDCRVTVEVSRVRSSRSDRQNRFYWGPVLDTLAAHTGYAKNELHEILKAQLLPPRWATLAGKTVKLPASTATLTVGEFAEYLVRIAADVAAPLGVALPNPNDWTGPDLR